MSEPFIGEIRIMACNYAPRDWALCSGQLLSIQQYSALFAVIGKVYGGDGKTNFALPNLAGRVPLHRGQGPGLSMNHAMGEAMGATTVALASNQLPAHTHGFNAVAGMAKQDPVSGALVSEMNTPSGSKPVAKQAYADAVPNVQLSANAISGVGSANPTAHQNCQPYQILNFCIALTGIFPVRP
jgi:microcystin-dependent protein